MTFGHHTTNLDHIHIISSNTNTEKPDGDTIIATLVDAQKSTKKMAIRYPHTNS